MLHKLIFIFNKKNEQAVRNQYMYSLHTLKEEMLNQNVKVFVNFVEENIDVSDVSDVAQATDDKEDALYVRHSTDTLYLTDTPSHLDMLKLWGYYAVALIHDYNKEISFRNADYLIEGMDGLEYNYLDKVYRRLAKIPWDILETERLLVRESTVKDVDDFYRIYSEPSITYYMEDLFKEPDMERMYMKNYIRRVYGFYGYGMWTVILKETGQVIGRAGLSMRDGYALPELGFVIEAAHQRQGYASEVCRAILIYARKELQVSAVQALVCKENTASVMLLKSLGFVYKENVEESGLEYQLWIKDWSATGK